MSDLGACAGDRTSGTSLGPCSRAGPVAAALWIILSLAPVAGCGGPPAPLIAPDELSDVFQGLHAPVYSIYELGPDRDAVHDLLAASFSGRQLTREYVEHYSTLVRMQQEETSIDVLRVDYDRIEPLDIGPDRVRVDADWSVGGVITHQGHKHPRVNRYRAVYTLAAGEDGVRIVATRMSNLQRIRTPLVNTGDWPFEEKTGSGGGLLDPVDYLLSGLYDSGSRDGSNEPATPSEQPADPFGVEVEPDEPATPSGQPADPFGIEVEPDEPETPAGQPADPFGIEVETP